jgi:hypothetical protein
VRAARTGSGDRSAPSRLLPDWDDRLPWEKASGAVAATEILRGSDETDLVVVLAHAPAQPTKGDLQAAWRARSAGGVAPVLLAVIYREGSQSRVALLGLTEDAVPVTGIDQRVAEQLISDALVMASPSGLHAEVRRRLSSIAGGIASGVRNEGLLASHVLQQQPRDPGWEKLCARSQLLLGDRSEALLTGLGYAIEPVPDGTVLREIGAGNRRAAAVLLADGESFDNPLSRFHNTNAVTHGLAVARRENVDWLIVLGGSVVRLYPRDPDAGVGRKGQTQTYVELDLSILAGEECGYLALLFAPGSLAAGGALYRLLGDSSRYAAELSARLRDRIYEDVVRNLSVAVAGRMSISGRPGGQQKAALDEAYHQTMIILFRLLFVAYAEDRGLLPYGRSDRYTRNALKTLALDLQKDPGQRFDPHSTSLWDDLTQVWKVIDTGDLGGWGVPAYNGGLFTRDPEKNASGAATYTLDLGNDQIGPALRGLLLDVTDDGQLGPVDFRSLSVREFGTIYEGLLESGLGVAETDLAVDEKDTYVPARAGMPVAVAAGAVYFHSRSGSRKATGSYFTKPFAVEHLLDTALESAIDAHLAGVSRLLSAGATKTAAEALFDFRVADLSMGSAHFLVAAVDRIEARFSAFLSENPLPEVAVQLHDLRTVAASQLGLEPAASGIDDGALLRRQIARRCMYGVDINEIAVELARLAIWIHTFVPGLPLSFLNHSLIHGNSLTGVGTIPEISQALTDAEMRELRKKNTQQGTVLDDVLDGFLDRAKEYLAGLAELSDARVGDVAAAAALQARLEESLEPLAAFCDLITAERATRHLGNEYVEETTYDRNGRNPKTRRRSVPHRDRILISASPALFTAATVEALETAILGHPHLQRARQIAKAVMAAHLPVRFPEVFRRDRPGFDCILGNPPWEKLKVEEHGWWALRFPGLRSMGQQDKNDTIAALKQDRLDLLAEYEADVASAKAAANILAAGPFPGLRAATDTDLFTAFAWRFWHEMRDGGFTGVVLPRTAFAGSGAEEWRRTVLTDGAFVDVTFLTNTARWAFDMEPRYTVGLVTARKTDLDHRVSLRGPFSSYEKYVQGETAPAAVFAGADVAGWTERAAFPLLPDDRGTEVFAQLRRHPSLASDVGDWHFQPLRELHTSDNRNFYDFHLTTPEASHTLPVWSGAAFNLWDPTSGPPYAFADPKVVVPFLQERRSVSARRTDTPFTGLAARDLGSEDSLPMMAPRIAFRDVCRATDSRTMICALVPPGIALVHKAPYLLQQRGTKADEAYLLGIMSSLPFDWYARRFVEITMSYGLLNAFPVPRVNQSTGSVVGPDGHAMDLSGDFRPIRTRLIEISAQLAAADKRYSEWLADVGTAPAAHVGAEARQDLIDEVNALAGLLYGLTAEHLTTVFETFHPGWNYAPRLTAALAHHSKWSKMTGIAARKGHPDDAG